MMTLQRSRGLNPNVIVAVLALAAFLWMATDTWIASHTVPWLQSEPDKLWQVSISGFDFGLDAYPLRPEHVGYLELWVSQPQTTEVQTVLRLTPARPIIEPPREPLPHPRVKNAQQVSDTQVSVHQ
ncbi:MAG: hypothetical protein GFH27_549289n259 [Chloroflexi bacterium AL-W]|nr:hypothetical protein [Chloroflexi bacterium AL-N1]NOK66991.1 hypothetical protein [Chloroflexi bacterium AL-N10]NOK74717.1 hypothetical protein [Chloroflexi bacterium AL-N5]NOK81593.1 hypothetical protein [Chloroflexi bacterium AL-W]NOK89063.1 hypothetical protein [Chloroflexi bacterium AL-N15]